jgi:D-alanyl-D-alanine dipeptidase
VSYPNFEAFAVDPADLGIDTPTSPPLPLLVDPPAPPVHNPSGERLVEVSHPLISVLGCYHRVGLAGARPDTRLRAGALERLTRAVAILPPGFGLAVFDGWRSLQLQTELYRAAYSDPQLPPGFVAEPSTDPTKPPPHLTGGTVDLTLTYDRTPLALGTTFDDFSEAAHTAAFEETPSLVRALRRLLFWTMSEAGFVVLAQEWWHFEYGTGRWAAIRRSTPLYGATE